MTSPSVSVVVPVYNGSDYIEKTVTTILNQSYSDFELLLVNDGSRDNSAQLLQQLAQSDPRVRIFSKDNGGVACARNFGISQAEGQFIAFCDQDDIWHQEKLAKQIPLFENPDVGLVYCGAIAEYTDLGKTSKHGFKSKHRGDVFDQLVKLNMITCCSAVARKSALDKSGYFDDDRSLMGVDDWHLWLKLSLVCEVDFVEEHLCTHIFHGDNYSLNDQKMHDAEIVCLDKIAPLAAKAGRSPNWAAIKHQIHMRYAHSYVYTADFQLAATTFRRAYRETPTKSALLKFIFYRYLPVSLLQFLQNQKRRMVR